MEEAVRLCSRVGIMDHGKILALGTVEELLKQVPFAEEIQFKATAETERLCDDLRRLGELATATGWHCFRPGPEFRLSAFYLATERHGLPSRLFQVQRPSLETVFLQLTGKALRE
jgi:ABC-2 type transport system ATP-binding protein